MENNNGDDDKGQHLQSVYRVADPVLGALHGLWHLIILTSLLGKSCNYAHVLSEDMEASGVKSSAVNAEGCGLGSGPHALLWVVLRDVLAPAPSLSLALR